MPTESICTIYTVQPWYGDHTANVARRRCCRTGMERQLEYENFSWLRLLFCFVVADDAGYSGPSNRFRIMKRLQNY
jgi:hypothetical protein